VLRIQENELGQEGCRCIKRDLLSKEMGSEHHNRWLKKLNRVHEPLEQ
jgi:hypothetical protein